MKVTAAFAKVAISAAALGFVAYWMTSAPDPLPAATPDRSLQFEQGSAPWDADLVLPDTSDRIANYTMNVTLDTSSNTITGTELLEWRNTTGKPQRTFPFHLYHNAWRNNRSTFMTEGGGSIGDSGYTDILRALWLSNGKAIDITSSIRFIQPDDSNASDMTVCELSTPQAVRPGETLRLKINFATRQPSPISRTGVIRNYHFVAQWFPKIGVWWNGSWNCHQFHSVTEFFADFGRYDVTITVPNGYIIGATGGLARAITPNADRTTSHRFVQNDVHDFAWVTSPDLQVSVRRFSHVRPDPIERSDRHHALKEVDVILITQPHRENMIDRYFDATFKALRFYGEWYGEYPYDAVTVVDPANNSNSGGMEYPTIFTGGTSMFAPPEQSSPEGVTVHECGHQFWYGLVANNEFEEAWLDEGFNTYSTDRVMRYGWKPFKNVRFYFGGYGAGEEVGVPWAFDVDDAGLAGEVMFLRDYGQIDVMAKPGWKYSGTYGLNSYTKPALSLMTLENYLGEEMMYRLLRTYHHRYRFKHPTTEDFIRLVNEVSGKNYRWFFDQTWFSSDLFDYSIDQIRNHTIVDAADGPLGMIKSEVVVKREGEAKAPVDILVEFEDGTTVRESWDGQDRWKRCSYTTEHRVVKAIVDPDRKLIMDINWINNSKVVRPENYRSLAVSRFTRDVLFWVQMAMEMGM
jgi:hypothetical protein